MDPNPNPSFADASGVLVVRLGMFEHVVFSPIKTKGSQLNHDPRTPNVVLYRLA